MLPPPDCEWKPQSPRSPGAALPASCRKRSTTRTTGRRRKEKKKKAQGGRIESKARQGIARHKRGREGREGGRVQVMISMRNSGAQDAGEERGAVGGWEGSHARSFSPPEKDVK